MSYTATCRVSVQPGGSDVAFAGVVVGHVDDPGGNRNSDAALRLTARERQPPSFPAGRPHARFRGREVNSLAHIDEQIQRERTARRGWDNRSR